MPGPVGRGGSPARPIEPAAIIERVVVLGAGVMGAQIAALAANAGLHVDLLDLADDGDPAARARVGIEGLTTLRPPPLFLDELASQIHPGSFDDVEVLAGADWIIEAVVEDLDVKRQLLERVTPHLSAAALISSNTSGLSIASLAEACDEDVRRRFLGVHFFNPPRYMKLVEVIPGALTDAGVTAFLSAFAAQRLGKGVMVCRDTPNFIANRLGVFAIADAVQRMSQQGLTVEEADAVTGPALGRPRSATLRLCDLVGLDTLLHVAATSRVPPPDAVQALVDDGRLGAKTGAGFYRKTAAGIEAVDLQTLAYRPLQTVDTGLRTRGALADRLNDVWEATDRLGTFSREHLAATLAYCARCAGEIADGLEDIDRAMCWGFNWEAGPFELIDLIGAGRVRDAIADSGEDVPPLLDRILAAEPARVYVEPGATVLAPTGVERRPLRLAATPTDEEWLAGGEMMLDAEGMRLVYLGEGAAAIELRGKLNTLPPEVLRHVQEAVDKEAFDVLALTGAGGHFSAGADLKYVMQLIDAADWQGLEAYLVLFQETTSAVRYASVPIVAAARGLALGGGCELCLTSAARVVGGELRMGLVETKVGVIPGAGGCKEMVRRFGADIETAFRTLQRGAMSDNGLQARSWGFVEDADPVYLDEERLLSPALARARELVDGGWQPPVAGALDVAGPTVLAGIEEGLSRSASEGDLSAHDVVVGRALAGVLCGAGETAPQSEARLLELEREAFLTLCGTPETRARMEHMLRTGKPLRN